MDNIDFKASFEQSSAMMLMLDPEFIIMAASDSFLEGTKTNRAQIVGQNAFDIFPNNPADSSGYGGNDILASLKRVLKNKTTDTINVIQYDIPKPAAEGGGFELRYWRPVHSPVLDENNNVKYIIQRVEDVTENERLVAMLKVEKDLLKQVGDSEKRYSMLLMRSPFAFAVFKGKEMIIKLANDSIKKIWNKEGPVEGVPLFDLLPQLRDTPFPGLIQEVFTTGVPFYGDELLAQFEREGKMEDSYFNFIYQPYLEADETISGVTVIVYDVTNKVLLKKALAEQRELEKKALKRVEESNARFYKMLMQSPFAFSVMKGKDAVVTLANDLMKFFWGKGNNIEGKALLDILPELKGQLFPDMINQVFTTGVPVYANEILAKLEHNGKLEDRYFNIVYQPHLEVDETISGVITIAYEVTEMVLVRKKVEDSEHRFQGAVAAVNGILWTNNAEGKMKGEQKGWEFLTGQNQAEYENYGWAEAIHPDEKNATLLFWKKAVKENNNFVFEHRLKLKDGTWGHFSVNAIPLLNSNGVVKEWVGVHTNISKQRLAEEAANLNELRFEQLVDSMPQKITNADVNGNLLFFNKQWIDDTGFSLAELKGGAWQKVLHPDDLETTLNAWNHSVNTGDILDLECRLLNKEGSYKWHLSRAVPIKNEYEKITMWVGSNTDIHEQKEQKNHLEKAVRERTKELEFTNQVLVCQNEEKENRTLDLVNLSGSLKVQQQELSKSNELLMVQEEKVKVINLQLSQLNQLLEERVAKRTKDLAESENKFRSMMETIPQIAWTNTIELKVNFYNKRWFDYTGLHFDHPELSVWRQIIHPEDLQETFNQFRAILKTMDGGGFQTRLKSFENKYRWHLIQLMPIKNDAGEMQLWMGTATDIQELRLLQDQKDDFISIASHELKTPITSLKIALQMLYKLKDDLSHQIIPELIIQANRSLDKFSVLIDDLLNASKANEGQLHLNKKLFVVSKLLKDCCENIRIDGEIHTLKIEGDMEVAVRADAAKIEQIVVNLVNNVIKYAPKSKEISILIERLQNKVKVSVIDKGPGISTKNIKHIFERYYRIDSNGTQYSGLGLGLYISSEIIKKHKGEIGVESEVGKGSCFWFTLPL